MTLDIGAAPLRRPPVVMLGRELELAWCADAFSRRRVLAIYGLAGIGKTSLLLTAAHDHARRTAGTVAYHACADGERIGDVLGGLLAGERPADRRISSLRAALDAVVEWARRVPLVLCIDDAHRLADPLLIDVLAHLGAAPAPLWIIVASRRQLPLPEADIDGAVLRIGPLSREGARALWDDLEERFGPSIARFDTIDGALNGIPFALRRAFATGQVGDASGVDLSGLAPDQAALLAQLCAFRGPVDVTRLAALIPDRMAALPALLHALLVEVTHTGSIAVHDLVRASVSRSARPPTTADHRVCLAFHDADNDALSRLHHIIGSEQWATAVELIDRIVRPQYGLFPLGAAVETQVLAAFAALERVRIELPLQLRLARLQLAARHGEGRVVLDALRSEAAREPAAWAHLATVELLLGESYAAEAHIRQALADPSISSGAVARAFLLAALLEVLRRQGNVEKVCAVVDDFKAVAAQFGPIGAGVAQVALAAIAYDQEDFEDAAERLASARPAISLLGFVPAFQATHALLERACSAALTRSPEDAPRPSAITRALFEDVDFLRATLLLFAADGDMFEGNVADAEARACDAEAIAVRGGYRGMQQWAMSTRAECLRMRGCAAAAFELAEQALADPLTALHRRQRVLFLTVSALSLAQLGRMQDARQRVGSLDELAHAPVRAARLSILPWIAPVPGGSTLARAELALAQLERALTGAQLDQAQRGSEAAGPVRSSRWRYLRARLAILDAELAVRVGDAAGAELALSEAEPLCAEGGYRREHATAALVSVALAQLQGDRERALDRARVASERAAGISTELELAAAWVLDGDERSPAKLAWIDRLELAAARSYRLRHPGAARYLTRRQADAVRFADGAFGVDALRQTIHVRGAAQSLAKRPGLWSMLSALVSEPGRVFSPDELARHAWGVRYHALRHRSRLVVTIKRLRDTLGGDAIIAVAGGYRLSVPAWTVLEPVNTTD